jgi:hypothetical protein
VFGVTGAALFHISVWQAAEKAIRGVQLLVDADRSHSKDLRASSWADVKTQAQQLQVTNIYSQVIKPYSISRGDK